MTLTTLKIYDPLDDPETFEFATKALKRNFGKNIEIIRTGFDADYYGGYDLIVVRSEEEIGIQAKTSSYKTSNKKNLKAHLNYENAKGHVCGFDLYDQKHSIQYFLFIWPNSGYAFMSTYRKTMDLWKAYNKTWKKNNSFCDNGCYVALKLEYFRKLLGKGNCSFCTIK